MPNQSKSIDGSLVLDQKELKGEYRAIVNEYYFARKFHAFTCISEGFYATFE
jgi:hypothetical protein